MKDALKTAGPWLGVASGVGVPAYTFYTSYAPPLFPAVSAITAALAGAIVLIVLASQPGVSPARGSLPNPIKLGITLIVASIPLLIIYILLFQFTTIEKPNSSGRVQGGFGLTSWSLTDVGKSWAVEPAMTKEKMIGYEAAFHQDRVAIVYQTWSIYAAGLLLIVIYFAAFGLWALGFAFLTKHRSTDRRAG